MSKQQWCPLTGTSDEGPCVENSCAWWDAAEENCAVLVLAQALKNIDYARTALLRALC